MNGNNRSRTNPSRTKKEKIHFFLWRLTFVASICKSNYTTESYMKKMPWGLYRKIITNLMYMYDI